MQSILLRRASCCRRFFRQKNWNSWTIELPGTYYLEVIEKLHRRNELAGGSFVALGQKIDLSRLRLPMYLLVGSADGVSPNWIKIKNPEHPAMTRVKDAFRWGHTSEESISMIVSAVHRQRRGGNHVRCPACGGWVHISDMGSVVDHSGPLPHPAIDQPQ